MANTALSPKFFFGDVMKIYDFNPPHKKILGDEGEGGRNMLIYFWYFMQNKSNLSPSKEKIEHLKIPPLPALSDKKCYLWAKLSKFFLFMETKHF